jgi:mono/diheme cytochrome c family protein
MAKRKDIKPTCKIRPGCPPSEIDRMIDLPMRPASPLGFFLLIFVGLASSRADEPSAPPIVPGFERFYSDPRSDSPAGGLLLMGELNCISCHKGDQTPFGPVKSKQAPILDKVGDRIKVDHLRAYLTNPHAVNPGTTMPNLLDGLPKAEAEEAVDALVHFLASTGKPRETPPSRKSVNSGRTLYNQSGCAVCHGVVGDKSSTDLPTTVSLGDVASKYTVESLASFVQDPLTTRPSGRMPGLNLKAEEAQSIASFLLKDIKVDTPPNLAYRYYEGDWDKIPDFDKLTPVESGQSEGFDVAMARRHSNYALRFEGEIEVDRPGPYSFHLASDDGSKLWVDDRLVADNDGIHPNSQKVGRIRLTRGRHKIVVGFFQGGGEEELDVDYEGPGLSLRPLASAILAPPGKSQTRPAAAPEFVPDLAKVEKGRALFASIGCASCHQLREGEKLVEARPASKPLADLKSEGGCLAAQPARGVPNFGLSPRQRTALASAIKTNAWAKFSSEKESIHRTLVAFNCYACHVRDGVGGVEEGRDAVFATTQKEMGEEGRIPPLLTGVGGKLTEAWLKHVLADGAKDRPYMLTKMPKFGEANVGHLVAPMGLIDAVEPVPVPHFDVSEKRVKATGRFIVGSQAFNCGSCHQFKENQASGIQALDMTLMTRRLRRDWFHRYVVNPQQFRPGTRMPAAWPDGKSQLETIYDGDTLKQIESIWVYLSDGPNAAVPYGLGRSPIPLVAEKEPVIYRNFIEGAGPRAIGVGYPEKANLAFDANELRLALIWQGAFIDASKHWTGRGEGFQGPLGDNALALPSGPAFATLSNEKAEWPRQKARELGEKFKGYRLSSGGKPVFQYDLGSTHVEDFPEAVSGGEVASIRRTIDLISDQPVRDLYFRAAVGKKIVATGDGWYQVDGEWKLRISTDSTPILRESAGKTELIVPVKLEAGKGRIVEEYVW